MKNPLHILSLLTLMLLTASYTGAQSAVTIRAGIPKTTWLIGEQVTLSLEASFPPGQPFSFFAMDSFEHFEIIRLTPIDTIDTDEGGVQLKQELLLTSFDSGHWVIPSFYLTSNDSLVTDSIPVDIVFSDFNPQQEYHDVKDILDVKVKDKNPWWTWYAAAGAALLLVLFIWLVTRKKKKTGLDVSGVVFRVDYYAEAMEALQKLQAQKSGPKHFHSGITEIFRWYLLNRKGIASDKQVTDELVLQLKALGIPRDEFNQLAQALRLTDFVKFAKYESSEQDDQFVFDTIKQSIQFIEKSST